MLLCGDDVSLRLSVSARYDGAGIDLRRYTVAFESYGAVAKQLRGLAPSKSTGHDVLQHVNDPMNPFWEAREDNAHARQTCLAVSRTMRNHRFGPFPPPRALSEPSGSEVVLYLIDDRPGSLRTAQQELSRNLKGVH